VRFIGCKDGGSPIYPTIGDGGAATNASLGPTGVALDASGDLYIADPSNERIRKVDTSGFITTVAGNGRIRYSGDGGAATNAILWAPVGIAFDASGNLFIADYNNDRIRKVLNYAGNSTFTLNNIGAISAGNYTVVITSSYGSVTSAVATLTLPIPPVITSQPTNQITAVGSSPSISVTVAGSGPFGYEWYFGGINLVQSGTNSTLTLLGVTTNNTGNYMVVVTNNYGSVTSQIATLTVALPPSITIQPASQTNVTSFSVAVAGIGPFTYQWQFNGTNLPNNIITTVAGNGNAGNYGFSGDGGAATKASLHTPWDVAFDALGNFYIADRDNQRIRKVDTNGIITTVAGGGSVFPGNGGAATNASMDPIGVAFDGTGNFYVSDRGGGRIRKVDTNGIITSVAGGGSASPGNGGAATNANLSFPALFGVVCDASGNLYFADFSLIRKVDTNGIITTFAGGGSHGDGGVATNASLSGPCFLVFDASGNLYIADSGDNRIRKVDTNDIITTVAGNGNLGYSGDGGAAINASLNNPEGVTFDAFGNLFIADSHNGLVRKVDTNGIITTVAGGGLGGDGGAATNAYVAPDGMAFDASGNLYIADSGYNRIRKVWFAGNPAFTLNNIGLTNAGNYTVVISSPYGSVTSAVATLTVFTLQFTASPTYGTEPLTEQFTSPNIDSAGNAIMQWNWNFGDGSTSSLQSPSHIYTTFCTYYPSLTATNSNGTDVLCYGPPITVDYANPYTFTTIAGLAGVTGSTDGTGSAARFNEPYGVSVDNVGNVYVADRGNGMIRKVTQAGVVTTLAALFLYPSGLTVDSAGNIYVADSGNETIRKMTPMGTNWVVTTLAGLAGVSGSTDGTNSTARFYFASGNGTTGVAVDSAGNIYVADAFNNTIRRGFLTNGAPVILTSGANLTFSNGLFGFILTAAAGQQVVVEGSTDLVNWLPLFTNTANGTPTNFIDSASTNFPGRFYRARLSQ
jgi:sugar lactone lactonase YvrE